MYILTSVVYDNHSLDNFRTRVVDAMPFTDMWSLAVVIFFACFNKSPFDVLADDLIGQIENLDQVAEVRHGGFLLASLSVSLCLSSPCLYLSVVCHCSFPVSG